jgi:cobalt/nickel transport system permease protein
MPVRASNTQQTSPVSGRHRNTGTAKHRNTGLTPGIKLASALFLVVAIALMPRRPHLAYFIPAAIIFGFWILTRMPFMLGVKRLLLAEVFILGIAVLSLLHPAALPIFLSALIKSNLCVLAILILGWTTPFHEILGELRRVGLPPIMVTTIALMHRYLPVLAEESRRMQRARASRSFNRKGRLGFEWRSLSAVAGQLFIRSAQRAERIYLAMCARGWK